MKRAQFGRVAALDYSGNEAMNTICSNLSFAGRDLKKIVITSCSAGEGKSYMTMQIAQNLARRGKRIVVVDADLRRSYIVKQYELATEGEWKGLAHYLAGYETLENVLYETNLYGLCVIPAGRDVSNPIPLLTSPYFSGLLNDLASAFDFVLIDSPPIGLVIDPAEIAQACDGAVFVVEYCKTRRRDVLDAKRQMEKAGCPILGCIINNMTFDSLSAKRYYNRSYYTHYSSEYYRKPTFQNGKKQR